MRTMDLTDLHIFRSVVQAGGITRAAEKLNRVQSNVTTRVRQLEAELGVELFIRNGKKLHLSPAGKLLLDYADRLLDLADEAREAVHDAKPRGLLRLGSMESTASIRLPPAITAICRVTPRSLWSCASGRRASSRPRCGKESSTARWWRSPLPTHRSRRSRSTRKSS
jgi:DNA-binding transcriptional LysR family regulator